MRRGVLHELDFVAPTPERDDASALQRRMAAHWRWFARSTDPDTVLHTATWLAGSLAAADAAGQSALEGPAGLQLGFVADRTAVDEQLLVRLAAHPGLGATDRDVLLEVVLVYGDWVDRLASRLHRLGATESVLRAAAELRPWPMFLDEGLAQFTDAAWERLRELVRDSPELAETFFTVRINEEHLLAAPLDALSLLGSGHRQLTEVLRRELPQPAWGVACRLIPSFRGCVADLLTATAAIAAPVPAA